MTGINKAPINFDIETDFIYPQATLQPSRLGKGDCIAVIIQNRLNNEDATQTGNNLELVVGKGAGQIYQMLPGQESPVIYCKDLEEIYVRVRITAGGLSSVFYTVIVYKRRKE